MTMCLYLMAAFEKSRRRSPEAGLKYFIYGSVSSALFLFGLSLVYGMTGSTRMDAIASVLGTPGLQRPGLEGNLAGAAALILILVGLGFKIAAVPFHQWAPDIYEGAPSPVSAWIAAGSKLASFIALMKVLNYALAPWAAPGDLLSHPGWLGLLAIISAVTMTFGNLAALGQRSLKRLLAYSSIAHAGYMLVGVVAISTRSHNELAAGAVLFYLVVYSLTILGAFALAAWLVRDTSSDRIDDLNGLGLQAPFLSFCLVLVMLSLIGVPPLGGFFGKLYLFMEALDTRETGRISLTWLVALGLLNTVISAFYYVRILKALYFRKPGRVVLRTAPAGVSIPIVLAALAVLVIGLAPALLLDTMRSAALPMLTRAEPPPPAPSPPPRRPRP